MVPYFAIKDDTQSVSAYYEWIEEDTLALNWVWRETPHRDKLTIRFGSDEAELICPVSASGSFMGTESVNLTGKTGCKGEPG